LITDLKKGKIMKELNEMIERLKNNSYVKVKPELIPDGFGKTCHCKWEYEIPDYINGMCYIVEGKDKLNKKKYFIRYKDVSRFYCPKCGIELRRIG
jgi:hypothetical protein